MREFAEETGIRIDDPARFVPDLPISEMPGRMPVLLSVFRIAIDEREFDSRGSHDGDIVSVEAVSYGDIPEKITSGEIYLSSPVALISRLLLETSLKKNTAGDLP
ncbi:MAG: hypothetical protein A4E61_01933 [Syntrophorhabdus sp. PtaB.Bin184]|nr:MAG: hypothetical protein A4E61_01933 [Syntrophorhabdus sp. PtaB.Bin184]